MRTDERVDEGMDKMLAQEALRRDPNAPEDG
jgi:hypothetical protein